jgi:hypothetical protein
MTYRAVLSEPTIVLPNSSDKGLVSAGTSAQIQLDDRPPAKRPHEPDNPRNDTVADSETGSKKKKKKRMKGELNS